MIAIIDYFMGNLRSVQKGLEKCGHNSKITHDKKEISKAKGIILPGVGAFKDCMKNLEKLELTDVIKRSIESGIPFLGICLGLQVLFTESEEDGVHKGLDVFKGRVVRLPREVKVPHMGWNTVKKKDADLLSEISDNSYFYFVHSYYAVPEDKKIIGGTTDYGVEFTSVISKDNAMAVQFHPEKSSENGLKILNRFGVICK